MYWYLWKWLDDLIPAGMPIPHHIFEDEDPNQVWSIFAIPDKPGPIPDQELPGACTEDDVYTGTWSEWKIQEPVLSLAHCKMSEWKVRVEHFKHSLAHWKTSVIPRKGRETCELIVDEDYEIPLRPLSSGVADTSSLTWEDPPAPDEKERGEIQIRMRRDILDAEDAWEDWFESKPTVRDGSFGSQDDWASAVSQFEMQWAAWLLAEPWRYCPVTKERIPRRSWPPYRGGPVPQECPIHLLVTPAGPRRSERIRQLSRKTELLRSGNLEEQRHKKMKGKLITAVEVSSLFPNRSEKVCYYFL